MGHAARDPDLVGTPLAPDTGWEKNTNMNHEIIRRFSRINEKDHLDL